jgi:hypothetical protein
MRIAGYVKFGLLVIGVAGVVALATPEHTSIALRVAVFFLASTLAVALLDFARRRAPPPAPSPFEPRPTPVPPPGPPADVVRLALELRAYDAASEGGTVPTVVPGALRRSMQAIVRSRLAARPDAIVAAPLPAALDGEPVTASVDDLLAALEAV